MRGAPWIMQVSLLRTGIIPADAGSTCLIQSMNDLWKDHPRGCGEHLSRSCESWSGSGSSPRMRGAPVLAFIFWRVCGIIPADAGSTPITCEKSALTWDHPRGCGEHGCGPDELDSDEGSSPRMRGAHMRERRWKWPMRIIPADAGSTC